MRYSHYRSIAIAFALAALSACEEGFGPGRDVTLPITEIDAPNEISPGESLNIEVTVQVGGCLRFEGLSASRTPGRVTITARGHDGSGRTDSCPGDIRYEVARTRVDPPITDPFTIVARQPDGTETVRVVRVR